jgi:hypothetical protein
LGACQSEKLELELARSLCASGSITDMVRLIIHKSREKSYHCRRMGDYAATREGPSPRLPRADGGQAGPGGALVSSLRFKCDREHDAMATGLIIGASRGSAGAVSPKNSYWPPQVRKNSWRRARDGHRETRSSLMDAVLHENHRK